MVLFEDLLLLVIVQDDTHYKYKGHVEVSNSMNVAQLQLITIYYLLYTISSTVVDRLYMHWSSTFCSSEDLHRSDMEAMRISMKAIGCFKTSCLLIILIII